MQVKRGTCFALVRQGYGSDEAVLAVDFDRLALECDEARSLLREIGVGIAKREMPTEQQLNAWFERIETTLGA